MSPVIVVGPVFVIVEPASSANESAVPSGTGDAAPALSNMANRPEGMLAISRADVPEEVRPAVDAWVRDHGGQIAEEPLIVVQGGKTPPGGGGKQFYVLPPAALAASTE